MQLQILNCKNSLCLIVPLWMNYHNEFTLKDLLLPSQPNKLSSVFSKQNKFDGSELTVPGQLGKSNSAFTYSKDNKSEYGEPLLLPGHLNKISSAFSKDNKVNISQTSLKQPSVPNQTNKVTCNFSKDNKIDKIDIDTSFKELNIPSQLTKIGSGFNKEKNQNEVSLKDLQIPNKLLKINSFLSRQLKGDNQLSYKELNPFNKTLKINSVTSKQRYPFYKLINNQYLSYIIIFLASFLIVVSFIYANENNFSFMETCLSKYFVQIVFTYLVCTLKGLKKNYSNPIESKKLLTKSAIFTFNTAVLAWSQFYLPLYMVHSISCIGSVMTLILNCYLNNIKLNVNQINGNTIAFIGFFFLIFGRSISELLWESQFQSQFQNYVTTNEFTLLMVSVVVLLSTFLWSYANVTTRSFTSSSWEIIHHQSIVGLVFSGVSYLFVRNPVSIQAFCSSLLYIGVFQTVAIFLFNLSAYVSQNAKITTNMTQNVILISYAISIIRYEESINVITLFGAILLIAAGNDVNNLINGVFNESLNTAVFPILKSINSTIKLQTSIGYIFRKVSTEQTLRKCLN